MFYFIIFPVNNIYFTFYLKEFVGGFLLKEDRCILLSINKLRIVWISIEWFKICILMVKTLLQLISLNTVNILYKLTYFKND